MSFDRHVIELATSGDQAAIRHINQLTAALERQALQANATAGQIKAFTDALKIQTAVAASHATEAMGGQVAIPAGSRDVDILNRTRAMQTRMAARRLREFEYNSPTYTATRDMKRELAERSYNNYSYGRADYDATIKMRREQASRKI